MRAFITACVVSIIIAIIGYYAVESVQQPTSVAYTTQSARTSTQ